MRAILEYGGQSKRTSALFETSTPLLNAKKFFKGLKGVENVYTRHKPLLCDTLDALIRGRLKENQFPYIGEQRLDR